MTKIQWTDRTWNPVRGCSRVSEGCRHCYAERMAARFSGPGQPYEGLATRTPARWTGHVRVVEERLFDPFGWRRPHRVFVNSMSDLFHESLPDAAIDKIMTIIARTPQHQYQVLTKRPERMRRYMWEAGASALRFVRFARDLAWPPPNVWLGVSVEDQATAADRIPHLLDTPAAVRFVSYEPALGPLDLNSRLFVTCPVHDFPGGFCLQDCGHWRWLDWVIVGGESGPGARPLDPAWVEQVIAFCRAAGIPCFVKQLGSTWARERSRATGQRHDPKGGDPAEWPADLRMREFPPP